jgi:hypothetical protein
VNVFGLLDLVVALTLGAVTGFQLLNAPSNELIGQLPFALIPTAAVPLLLALHIRSLSTLLKTRRTTTAAVRNVVRSAEDQTATALAQRP